MRWDLEPAISGYRKLTFKNEKSADLIDVPVSASPLAIEGVGVVVGSDDGYIRLFDPSLAKVFWWVRVQSPIYASLVADPIRRRILVADTSGRVHSISTRGHVVWSRATGHPIFATPTLLAGEGLLVLSTFGWRSIGLDLETGDILFDRQLPPPWHAAYGGMVAHRDAYASPAVTSNGTLIACCGEHTVALAIDGSERWRNDLGTALRASPVVIGQYGLVVAFGVDGRCVVLDAETGVLRRQRAFGSKITASSALSQDIVAIGLQGGRSVGVNARTLDPVWETQQGAPCQFTSFSTLPNGDFICTNERGNVLCLGAKNGAFRWETSQVLGIPNHEPRMDVTPIAARDGNLYCASYRGDVYRFVFRVKGDDVSE